MGLQVMRKRRVFRQANAHSICCGGSLMVCSIHICVLQVQWSSACFHTRQPWCRVKFTNYSKQTVQLKTRHWVITDQNGEVKHVRCARW